MEECSLSLYRHLGEHEQRKRRNLEEFQGDGQKQRWDLVERGITRSIRKDL